MYALWYCTMKLWNLCKFCNQMLFSVRHFAAWLLYWRICDKVFNTLTGEIEKYRELLNTVRVELEPWEKHIILCESKIGVTSSASKLLKDKVSGNIQFQTPCTVPGVSYHSVEWWKSVMKLFIWRHESQFISVTDMEMSSLEIGDWGLWHNYRWFS